MTLKYTHPLEMHGGEVIMSIEAIYYPCVMAERFQPEESEMIELQTIFGDNGVDYTNADFTAEQVEEMEAAGFTAAAEFYETKSAEREQSPFSEFV